MKRKIIKKLRKMIPLTLGLIFALSSIMTGVTAVGAAGLQDGLTASLTTSQSGDNVDVNATVTNIGDVKVENIQMDLSIPDGMQLVSQSTSSQVSELEAGKTWTSETVSLSLPQTGDWTSIFTSGGNVKIENGTVTLSAVDGTAAKFDSRGVKNIWGVDKNGNASKSFDVEFELQVNNCTGQEVIQIPTGGKRVYAYAKWNEFWVQAPNIEGTPKYLKIPCDMSQKHTYRFIYDSENDVLVVYIDNEYKGTIYGLNANNDQAGLYFYNPQSSEMVVSNVVIREYNDWITKFTASGNVKLTDDTIVLSANNGDAVFSNRGVENVWGVDEEGNAAKSFDVEFDLQINTGTGSEGIQITNGGERVMVYPKTWGIKVQQSDGTYLDISCDTSQNHTYRFIYDSEKKLMDVYIDNVYKGTTNGIKGENSDLAGLYFWNPSSSSEMVISNVAIREYSTWIKNYNFTATGAGAATYAHTAVISANNGDGSLSNRGVENVWGVDEDGNAEKSFDVELDLQINSGTNQECIQITNGGERVMVYLKTWGIKVQQGDGTYLDISCDTSQNHTYRFVYDFEKKMIDVYIDNVYKGTTNGIKENADKAGLYFWNPSVSQMVITNVVIHTVDESETAEGFSYTFDGTEDYTAWNWGSASTWKIENGILQSNNQAYMVRDDAKHNIQWGDAEDFVLKAKVKVPSFGYTFGFLLYYPGKVVQAYMRPEGFSLISQPHETGSDVFCFTTGENAEWHELEFRTYNCGENVIIYVDGQQVLDAPTNPSTQTENFLNIYTQGIGKEAAYLMIDEISFEPISYEISVESPVLNTEYTQGEIITLQAVVDKGLNIPSVNYKINNQIVATGTAENNYVATLENYLPGDYELVSEYVTETGEKYTSGSTTFTIVSNVSAALVTSKNSEGSVGVSLNVKDELNEVAKVSYFMNGIEVATSTEVPYNASIQLPTSDYYTLSAVLKDVNGIVLAKTSKGLMPNLTEQPSMNYSNEVTYTIAGESGDATVDMSNGIHRLYMKHALNKVTYLTADGEESYDLVGTGNFQILTDGIFADVYRNGQLAFSYLMPLATEVPTATEAPAATEEPVETETPVETEEPTETETPVATEEPVETETPAATETPTTAPTEAPAVTPTIAPTEAPETEAPEPETPNSEAPQSTEIDSAQTGDNGITSVWPILMLVSGIGIILYILKKYRKGASRLLSLLIATTLGIGAMSTVTVEAATRKSFTVSTEVTVGDEKFTISAEISYDEPTAGETSENVENVYDVPAIEDEKVKSEISENGLTVANYKVSIPENRSNYFVQRDVADEEVIYQIPNLPYYYNLDFMAGTGEEVQLVVNDGYYSTNLSLSEGKFYAWVMETPFSEPEWLEIADAVTSEEDVYYRVEMAAGMARLYGNGEWLTSFRGAQTVGEDTLAIHVTTGELAYVSLNEYTDLYFYSDDFSGDAELESADYWMAGSGTLSVADGAMKIDASGKTDVIAEMAAYAGELDFSGTVDVQNRVGGFWIITSHSTSTTYSKIGYNFQTGKYELIQVVDGLEVNSQSVAGTLPTGDVTFDVRVQEKDTGKCVDFYVNDQLIFDQVPTANHRGKVGFILDDCVASVKDVSYRGDAKPMLGVAEYIAGNQYHTRDMIENEEGIILTNRYDAFITRDGGKTWSSYKFADTHPYAVENQIARLASGELLSMKRVTEGTDDAGREIYNYECYMSTDEGATWTKQNSGLIMPVSLPGRQCICNRLTVGKSGRVYFSPGETGDEAYGALTVYYSDDKGATWYPSNTHMNAKETGFAIQEAVVHETGDITRCYFRSDTGTVCYFNSTDRGETWDLTPHEMPMFSSTATFNVEVDPEDGTMYMAWTYDNTNQAGRSQYPRTRWGLAMSTDNGENWEWIGTPFENNASNYSMMNLCITVADDYLVINCPSYDYTSGSGSYYNRFVTIAKDTLKTTKRFEQLHELECIKNHADVEMLSVVNDFKKSNVLVVDADSERCVVNGQCVEGASYVENGVTYVSWPYAATVVGATVTESDAEYISLDDFAATYGFKVIDSNGTKIVSKYDNKDWTSRQIKALRLAIDMFANANEF